jgi:hypothetical protein
MAVLAFQHAKHGSLVLEQDLGEHVDHVDHMYHAKASHMGSHGSGDSEQDHGGLRDHVEELHVKKDHTKGLVAKKEPVT